MAVWGADDEPIINAGFRRSRSGLTSTPVAGGSAAVGSNRIARRWQIGYARRLFVTDLAATTLAVGFSQVIWIGSGEAELSVTSADIRAFGISYSAVSIAVVAVWMFFLNYFATRDQRIVGSGTTEYKRLADATLRLFGIFAIIAFLVQAQLGRGYFLTVLPLGLLLLLASRWVWRQWLRREQRKGNYLSRTLLIGHRSSASHVADSLLRDSSTGLLAVGALIKDASAKHDIVPGVPVLGGFTDVLSAVDRYEIETVIVTGTHDISPHDMRELGWRLEDRGTSLIVAPALTDVAGPRIHARPVAGLPLIHVDFPRFEGRKRVSKRFFDILGSGVLLILSSPMMIAVGIAVKTTSAGPIFYTQERIGRQGKPFKMVKFRSMVHGADDQLKSLLDLQGTATRPLFKVNNDPRITRVGRFIRKYSLDEFPQLFNVFAGQMSLVGPRPQRESEVALYDDAAHRRLLMKPGMSGLWQVSGRSKLSWDDAIRLDLYYVENWTMTGDFIILWRTVRAVTSGDGAH